MTNTIRLKELAYREHDGLQVTLLWDEDSNEVSIGLIDERNDNSFWLPIAPGSALDAFEHPYVYAPAWIDPGCVLSRVALADTPK
jgi:hypothetical protein